MRPRTQRIDAARAGLWPRPGGRRPEGPASLEGLEPALEDPARGLPGAVREMRALCLERIARLAEAIERRAGEPEAASRRDAERRRRCTVPGIGPVTAGAVAAVAPDLAPFESARNAAAGWGLVPRQRSTGGKAWLGAASERGRTDIRRRLIVGAMSVIRRGVRKGGSPNRRLARWVARKPKTVAAVALACEMARMIGAVTTKQGDGRRA